MAMGIGSRGNNAKTRIQTKIHIAMIKIPFPDGCVELSYRESGITLWFPPDIVLGAGKYHSAYENFAMIRDKDGKIKESSLYTDIKSTIVRLPLHKPETIGILRSCVPTLITRDGKQESRQEETFDELVEELLDKPLKKEILDGESLQIFKHAFCLFFHKRDLTTAYRDDEASSFNDFVLSFGDIWKRFDEASFLEDYADNSDLGLDIN